MTDVGTRFVTALVAKDTDALLSLLADDVELRGMTPGRFWEAHGAHQAVHEVLYRWFEPTDVVEHVEQLEVGWAADRPRVDYRLHLRNPDGFFLVEQRAYLDTGAAGRVVRLEMVCAGFRPMAQP